MSTYRNAIRIRGEQYAFPASLSLLRQNGVLDPEMVDKATQAHCKGNRDLLRAKEARGDLQRRFDAARCRRRDRYAAYIQQVEAGIIDGATPPVTMYTPDSVSYDAESMELTIPGTAILTAHDGETQLSARFANGDPDGIFLVVLYASTAKDVAMVQLHDFNHYATPVSESVTALMNRGAALTAAILQGINDSARNADIVINRARDSVGQRAGGALTSQKRLLHAAIGAECGKDAFCTQANALISKANAQGSVLKNPEAVSGVIRDMLQLPDDVLPRINAEIALAVGAFYSENKRIPAIPTDSVIDALIKGIDIGTRVTTHSKAAAIFKALA